MAGDLRVIDADAHINEPIDVFADFLDDAHRDHRPLLIKDTKGLTRILMDGKLYPETRLRQNHVKKVQGTQLGGIQKGASDPVARLDDMDTDGIDVQVLYGSLGLSISTIGDVDFAIAMSRACNDYYASFCSGAPERLKCTATLRRAGRRRRGGGARTGGHRARARRRDAAAQPSRRRSRERLLPPDLREGPGARRAGLDPLGQRRPPAIGRRRALRHALHAPRRRPPGRADDRARQHRVRWRRRGLPRRCASGSSRPAADGPPTGWSVSTSTSSGVRARCRR